MTATLADRIAYWTRQVYIMDREVVAGLRHPDSQALVEARAVLRDLRDIDGDIPPEAA